MFFTKKPWPWILLNLDKLILRPVWMHGSTINIHSWGWNGKTLWVNTPLHSHSRFLFFTSQQELWIQGMIHMITKGFLFSDHSVNIDAHLWPRVACMHSRRHLEVNSKRLTELWWLIHNWLAEEDQAAIHFSLSVCLFACLSISFLCLWCTLCLFFSVSLFVCLSLSQSKCKRLEIG